MMSVNTSVLLAQQSNNLISYEDFKRNSSIDTSILKSNNFEFFQNSIIVPDFLSINLISEPSPNTIRLNWKMGDSRKNMRENIFGEVIRTILIETMR